jgi:DNA-binding MarR family transcriptional regulator
MSADESLVNEETPINDESFLMESLLGYRFRRISSMSMSTLGDMMTEVGLRVIDGSVLMKIAENRGVTSAELGRILGVLRANMTPMISNLTKLGFVEAKPLDGRSMGLYLTESGRSMCARVQMVSMSHDRQFFAALDDDERQQLLSLLAKVWDDVKDGKSLK